MNFAHQANKWLKGITTRKKHPVKASTAERYRVALDNSILPALGKVKLHDVNNKAAKEFVAGLDLSAATINLNLSIVKAVVKSYVDTEGNLLAPITWNPEYIDAPAIEDQNAPDLPLQTLQEALRRADGEHRALYALLAGSGLRISEALSLVVGDAPGANFWSPTQSFINIRHGKTDAATRIVDLAPSLNMFLAETLDAEDKLFPMTVKTYSREMKSVAGFTDFHRFRRFRLSHLDKQNVPNGLKKYWAGHAAADVTERYVKMGNDIEARKSWAEKAGLGFDL